MTPGPQRSRLEVAVSDERGRPVRPGLGRWLAAAAPARVRGLVNVALVSDRRVRALNKRYRGHDRSTDVLSFPASTSLPDRPVKRRAGSLLGDIVIAQGVTRRQARSAGHGEATELRILALHGLLHLLGYDHERDDGTMARVERRLRQKAGLREGLLERP